jgi:hypothetical protein
MLIVHGYETALHLTTDAGERRGRQHPFRRTAKAEIHVYSRLLRFGYVDHAGNVAVADQPERGACLTHLLDQLAVTGPCVRNLREELRC